MFLQLNILPTIKSQAQTFSNNMIKNLGLILILVCGLAQAVEYTQAKPHAQEESIIEHIYSPCLGVTDKPLPVPGDNEVEITFTFDSSLSGKQFQDLLIASGNYTWYSFHLDTCTSIKGGYIKFIANLETLGNHVKLGLGSKYGSFHNAINTCGNSMRENLWNTIQVYPNKDGIAFYYDLDLYNLVHIAHDVGGKPAAKYSTIYMGVGSHQFATDNEYYFEICGFDASSKSCTLPTYDNNQCSLT